MKDDSKKARKKQILGTIMFKGGSDELFDSSVAAGSKRSHYGALTAKAIWGLSNGFTLQKWGAELDEWMFGPSQVSKGSRECIRHHKITKEKHNQIKMETKQKRNKKWLKLPSRGEHVPILAHKGWNQIPEVGICNSHANCQAEEA